LSESHNILRQKRNTPTHLSDSILILYLFQDIFGHIKDELKQSGHKADNRDHSSHLQFHSRIKESRLKKQTAFVTDKA
jgi:hypothetical protein